MVWRLDRLARSVSSLIKIAERIDKLGAEFKSLTEAIDTSTPGGRFFFHLCGAMAEFERALIIERTNAGLRAARERGVKLGPHPKMTPEKLAQAREKIRELQSMPKAAKAVGLGTSTLYTYFPGGVEAVLQEEAA